MRIDQLYCYPVKSLKGIALNQAPVFTHGLAWDRRWMWVDQHQRFVTQRQLPTLATIDVALTDEALVLSHPNVAPCYVPLALPTGNLRVVKVWNDDCKALPESDDVSRWLVAALGEAAAGLTLMRFATEFARPVEAGAAHTYFADGYPFLITNTASLEALNEALIAKGLMPVPMNRFRPNIVVRHTAAWEEDRWQRMIADEVEFTLRKPCQRCKITTIDQHTAAIVETAQPLQTLLELNTQPRLKGAYFGQNATLSAGEGKTLRVGDALQTNFTTTYQDSE
ncbi:MOSC N-terminal beta barrel domain-containing protein [Halomonas vilamensis]|uniref:MOSC N-terminal beta barrel domain-containing protein n=1 Tax=Vreelandella vilamensis TaxID=531309 RepID=A0ABU1H0W1_9GAMM|nr:MOSC N-terminal beta barrel domain-containing protein [Halomonas vilamensis]MDR5897952.1 MOSC N-terminal beta barrel domain-containing protein [Halomonas vilamensis]